MPLRLSGSVLLKIVGAKISDGAVCAGGTAEVRENTPAILEPTGPDFPRVEPAGLECKMAVYQIT